MLVGMSEGLLRSVLKIWLWNQIDESGWLYKLSSAIHSDGHCIDKKGMEYFYQDLLRQLTSRLCKTLHTGTNQVCARNLYSMSDSGLTIQTAVRDHFNHSSCLKDIIFSWWCRCCDYLGVRRRVRVCVSTKYCFLAKA